MNLPNRISIARIAMIPVFALVFFMDFIPYNNVIAAAVFSVAAFTDFLDGYIARKNNLVTNLGKFLDPIADKVLVCCAFVFMLTDAEIIPELFSVAVALILAREFIIGGFRSVAAAKGTVLAADKAGKIKAVFQDFCVIVLLVGADFGNAYSALNVVGLVLLLIAAALTVYSGASYIIKNKSVLKD